MILSWNVRRLNCPNKTGDVRWVLHKYFCDFAVLQEHKMEDVNHPIVINLWGCRPTNWIFLPSTGRYGDINVI